MKKQSAIIAVVFSIVGTALSAPKSADPFKQFRNEQKSAVCKKRLDTLAEFRELFVLPASEKLLKTGHAPELYGAMEDWSTDLIIKMVMQAEQDFKVLCPEHRRLNSIITHLKRAYLHQLGFKASYLTPKATNTLFRALLVLRDEVPALRQQLAPLDASKAEGLLAQLFGKIEDLSGVAVLGATPGEFAELKSTVAEVCTGFTKCPFWDSNLVYKVVIQDNPGTALYIPEVGVLVLAKQLLGESNKLHRLVILHELAHVATRGAWVYQRKDWVHEFASFSNWKRDTAGKWEVVTRTPAGKREDEFTKLSKQSSFSILPDVVYLGETVGKKQYDGFVFSKSYEQSLKNNDPSEDLADHVAAYFYAPARYCLNGQNIAPEKYKWVAKNVFGRSPKVLNCKAEKTTQG
ncbi:MAG: hypothetical protein KDD51_10040 [Bdellovibrionales bacterium]|nr:hypothetical protein [Bdellovibrionales bacterium]